MCRGHRPRRVHGPRGRHAGLRDPQEEVLRAARPEGEVRQPGRRSAASSRKVIDAVFKAFEPFERYGFNKAHATCYGLIAYQTAYLKANYTVEYMTSVLTAFRDNAEKVAAAIAECRRLGIEVRPPDVHRSRPRVHGRGRRDPVRPAGGQERRRGRDRVDHRGAREGGRVPVADRLLHARRPAARQPQGARVAGQGRRAERRSDTRPRSCSGSTTRSRPGRRRSATGSPARRRCSTWAATTRQILERPLPVTPETPVRERLRWEKELLGLYLSDHPMGEVAERVGQFVTAYSGDLKDESLDGQRVVIGGIVTGVADRHHEVEVDDGGGDARGPAGDARGRRVPADLRADDRRCGARARSCWSPGGSTTRGDEASLLADAVWDWDEAADSRAGGVRARGRVARRAAGVGGPARTGTATATGPTGGYGAGPGRPGRPDGAAHRCARRAGPAGAERLAAACVGGDARRR